MYSIVGNSVYTNMERLNSSASNMYPVPNEWFMKTESPKKIRLSGKAQMAGWIGFLED